MASPEEYAQWIVSNQDKKGTPEFETVAKAYQLSRQQAVPAAAQAQPDTSFIGRAAEALKGAYSLTPAGMAQKGIEAFENSTYDVGGAVTDATGSPALGFGANVAMQAVPVLAGGGLGAASRAPMQAAGKSVMQSALKPQAKDILSGDAAKAVQTLLDEGVNATTGGAVKLRSAINALDSEIKQQISASTATVDKAHVMKEVHETLKTFRNQLNSASDEAAILKSWQETSSKLAAQIPVQEAQSLKQGTYKLLSDKYAKMGAVENEASTQAQMAGARGLRKGIEEAIPGIGGMNAQEAKLINALEMVERRSGIAGNKDIAGIAWLAQNPAAAAAMMADRSAAFKSALARLLYRTGRGPLPATVGAGTGGMVSSAISGEE